MLNDFLPALNASLNGSAALLLALGYYFIKSKRKQAHAATMIAAFAVSSAFLVSYLYYHFNFEARRFQGVGIVRTLYLSMLISHILGAIVLVPGVITILFQASQKNWQMHAKWARRVWPLWMYISVTGVLIYFCLYGPQINGEI